MSFAEIEARAWEKHGGREAVEAMLPQPKSSSELAAVPIDRYLAEMARRIFCSGFVWKVVDAKWPGFEEAFHGFDPGYIAMMPDEELDSLLSDKRIIRHGTKIRAVQENAVFLLDLQREHGSAAQFFADWPVEDIVGLWTLLKKRGSRLGGNTGQYFLRFIGKDTFILSRDVVAVLMRTGVIDKAPTSQKALGQVQDQFNEWRQETGRPLCQLSRLAALSVG